MAALGCGFNLLNLYHWHGQEPQPFDQEELRAVADWGFRFARIPTDHRFLWRDGQPVAAAWRVLDEGLEAAARVGVHWSLNLHHAPGFCINTPRESWTLWRDPSAQAETARILAHAAARWRGAADVSLDLINEPVGCTAAEYGPLVGMLLAAIRAEDPLRPVIVDGLDVGTVPLPDLAAEPGVVQSVHCYAPHWLTHYRAPWVFRDGDPYLEPPSWPGREMPRRGGDPAAQASGPLWDRERLRGWLKPWTDLARQGAAVHCGEFGVFSHTPRPAQHAWITDLLDLLAEAGIPWAMWNLEGPFGILNNGRPGQPLADGRVLDQELLRLLQTHLG